MYGYNNWGKPKQALYISKCCTADLWTVCLTCSHPIGVSIRVLASNKGCMLIDQDQILIAKTPAI